MSKPANFDMYSTDFDFKAATAPQEVQVMHYGSPTESLVRSACEQDETSLIEEAFASCPWEEGPADTSNRTLLEYSRDIAIANNAENVLRFLIEQKGLHVSELRPRTVAGKRRSKAILELLLKHGWDVNYRILDAADLDAEPFMWHVVHDEEMVEWCLDHGASVFPMDQEPLSTDYITKDQLSCRQALEVCAEKGSIKTFELLRSKRTRFFQRPPLGWRPLHLAVQQAAIWSHDPKEDTSADPETMESNRRKATRRMDMVRHLVDAVGLDVNALDTPVGVTAGGRSGPPINYVAEITGAYAKEVTWFLLDRGADPAPGLEWAKDFGNHAFMADVEAWKATGRSVRKLSSHDNTCVVQ